MCTFVFDWDETIVQTFFNRVNKYFQILDIFITLLNSHYPLVCQIFLPRAFPLVNISWHRHSPVANKYLILNLRKARDRPFQSNVQWGKISFTVRDFRWEIGQQLFFMLPKKIQNKKGFLTLGATMSRVPASATAKLAMMIKLFISADNEVFNVDWSLSLMITVCSLTHECKC